VKLLDGLYPQPHLDHAAITIEQDPRRDGLNAPRSVDLGILLLDDDPELISLRGEDLASFVRLPPDVDRYDCGAAGVFTRDLIVLTQDVAGWIAARAPIRPDEEE
jgi:hypothetical protein